MINFNEEIKKYKPILEIQGLEKSIREDEMADMLEILQHIARKDGGGKSDKK